LKKEKTLQIDIYRFFGDEEKIIFYFSNKRKIMKTFKA